MFEALLHFFGALGLGGSLIGLVYWAYRVDKPERDNRVKLQRLLIEYFENEYK